MWVSPDSLAGAAALLAEHGSDLRVIAGGTDLMVERKLGGADPAAGWLDISRLPTLKGISAEGDGLRIGAATSLRRIGQSAEVRARFPLLAASATVTGAIPIQNRATLGGNIANASPAADNPPVLLAYDASVELTGPDVSRRVPYREFHLGYKRTVRRPDELLAAVHLPTPPASGAVQFYRKVGTRQAQAIAKLSLAAVLVWDGDRLASAAFGLASVAPVPAQLPTLSAWLVGKGLGQIEPDTVRELLTRDIQPLDDIRSTAAYRREVAARLVMQALHTPPSAP